MNINIFLYLSYVLVHIYTNLIYKKYIFCILIIVLQFDKKKHYIEWHKSFIPFVARILRIERLVEEILYEVKCH